jgi:hypothetical protein
MKYTTDNIPPKKKRFWNEGYVTFNYGTRRDITDVAYIEATWPEHATFSYGMRPDETYDSWYIRQAHGGGVITIPYVQRDGQLYIGLVQETRTNMGDVPVWCAIGGFIDAGESAAVAQSREASEEAGVVADAATPSKGLGVIAERSFIVADAQQEGTKIFFHSIKEDLQQTEDGMLELKKSPIMSKEYTLCFFHWTQLPHICADSMALAGAYHLLSHLEHN